MGTGLCVTCVRQAISLWKVSRQMRMPSQNATTTVRHAAQNMANQNVKQPQQRWMLDVPVMHR